MKKKTTKTKPSKSRKLPLNSEGVPSRNELTLNAFTEYLIAHPEQRFFQALRNFFGVGYIGFSNDIITWQDTFYLEEGIDYFIDK